MCMFFWIYVRMSGNARPDFKKSAGHISSPCECVVATKSCLGTSSDSWLTLAAGWAQSMVIVYVHLLIMQTCYFGCWKTPPKWRKIEVSLPKCSGLTSDRRVLFGMSVTRSVINYGKCVTRSAMRCFIGLQIPIFFRLDYGYRRSYRYQLTCLWIRYVTISMCTVIRVVEAHLLN